MVPHPCVLETAAMCRGNGPSACRAEFHAPPVKDLIRYKQEKQNQVLTFFEVRGVDLTRAHRAFSIGH